MEDLHLSALLRVRQQMNPIRETFPRAQVGTEKPEFRFSYQYLRSNTLPVASPQKKSTRSSPKKAKQPARAKTNSDALLQPLALGESLRTQPQTAGSSFVQEVKTDQLPADESTRLTELPCSAERLSN